MKPRLAAMLLILLLPLASARGDEPIWHDDFESMAGWKVQTADGVELKLTQEPGLNGQCLRIDYDFTRGSGYGIIRHEFGVESPQILPENYRFNFALRGEGPPNTLEFKLVDESNDNVWWVNQRNIEFPKQWSRRTLQKRTFSFAWGPSGGKPIDKLGALEIVVTSFNGGKGTVWLDDLALQSLPPILPYEGTPSITVSSRADGGTGPLSINADNFLGWRSTPSNHDAEPTATIDFGQAREFGGLIIEWETDSLIEDCQKGVEADGLEGRAVKVGEMLKELDQAEAGLFVAALVARATKGVEKSEAEMLKNIGKAAGLGTDKVRDIVKKATTLAGD